MIICTLIGVASSTSTSSPDDEGFATLVAWMKLHGGRVDSRIDVATNANGIRGVVALSAIDEGTELLFCPWELVIGSTGMQDQMQKGDGMCSVVKQMAEQIRLTSQSLWHPYLDHIELPRLAAVWEASALAELQGLPPTQDADRHVRWFHQRCDGGDILDAAAMRSLVAFISRASEVGMVPIYDLLNHHNGKRNAKLTLTNEGVTLITVGDGNIIQRGQEIYLSYGIKTASTIYRDYGFVEEWPTCWNFKDAASGDNFAFVVFPHGVVAINPSAEYLKYIWQTNNSSLDEFEAGAMRHTESLAVGDLERFAQAVRDHLEEFPSTLGEDELILEDYRKVLAEEQAALLVSSDSSNVEDMINAISYRIEFKSALTSSAIYAESMMASKIRQNVESQEL